MEQRHVKLRGTDGLNISEYQTTATGGFVWEAAFVLLRYIEQNGLPQAPPLRASSDGASGAHDVDFCRSLRVLDFSGGTGCLLYTSPSPRDRG